MFRGNYNFFDYKYNISGYTGQDFGGIAQYVYLIVSFLLIIILLFIFKNKSKTCINKIIRIVSIFLIVFYVSKVTWESFYDIKYDGSFNICLLPFDSCSIVMLAGIISGFCKGKLKDYSTCWLVTGCILGGLANMIFLNAFKYYPFFSFGAFYSMIWHFLMVFIGLLIAVSGYIKLDYSVVLKGFVFHLLFSLVVIPLDFIKNLDFMLYLNLGGVPIFEDIASKLTAANLQFLNPILMLVLYFVFFNIAYLLCLLVKKCYNLGKC